MAIKSPPPALRLVGAKNCAWEFGLFIFHGLCTQNQMVVAARKPQKMSQKQEPMFFKFMLPGFSEKLSLPRAFLKHLDGGRCDKATLKSTLGLSWHVKVWEDKEGVWFQDGWLDFVEEHDVKVGDCLVFRYEGDMSFFVTIFDTSACEKRLPFVKKDNKDHGKRRHMKDEKKLRLIMKKDKDHGEQRGGICKSSNAAAVERLLPRIAKNPHFEATITQSNLLRNSYMGIPAEFRKAYDVSRLHEMTLTDSKGRSWPVKVRRRARGDAFFCAGWSELRKSNGLQLGDAIGCGASRTWFQCLVDPNVGIGSRPNFQSVLKKIYP